MPLDAETVADAAAEAVTYIVREQKAQIAAQQKTIDGLLARLDVLEAREAMPGPPGEKGEAGPQGDPGRDADPDTVRAALADELKIWARKAIDDRVSEIRADVLKSIPEPIPGPPGERGKDADVEAVKAVLSEELKGWAREAIDDRMAEVRADVLKAIPESLPGPQGERGEPGPAGKDADHAAIAALLVPEVEKAVASLPRPEKGDSGDPGEPGPAGKDADVDALRAEVLNGLRDEANVQLKAMVEATRKEVLASIPPPEKGEKGHDGVGLAGAIIDRSGHLVVTMTNGTAQSLGLVVGKDGDDGAPGLGFDDMEVLYDGRRSFTFRFMKGEKAKEFMFNAPIPLDAGFYKAGEKYEKADLVQFGGSMWIAQEDTTDKPGEGKAWRLSSKRGRDGNPLDAEKFMDRMAPDIQKRLIPGVRKLVADEIEKLKNG